MASNGLDNMAKHGKCRICQRVRNVNKHLKSVGEVRHGYATGHIWECCDEEECQRAAERKLSDNKVEGWKKERIRSAMRQGRFTKYIIYS